MEQLDTIVQDAKALLKTAQKRAAGLETDGIDPDLVAALATVIERTLAADTSQRNAIRDVNRYTDAQNRAVDKAYVLIGKERDAAKGRFGAKDAQMMREFAVGKPRPASVKELITGLAFMKKAAEKYLGELAKNGFKAADLAALTAAAAEVEMADANQELAKKAQKNATQARNDAVRELRQTVQKVRSTAKSVFAGQRDMLTEFESIVRAKAVRAKEQSAGAGA